MQARLAHRAVPLAAAAIALAAAIPVMAAGGPPRLGDFQAGPYTLALYNDSPSLVVGRNVLTLDVPAEVAGGTVRLEFLGRDGQSRAVSLRRVTMLGDASSGHGASGGEHESAGATDHATAGSDHPPGSTGEDPSGAGHQVSGGMDHAVAGSGGESAGHNASGSGHQGSGGGHDTTGASAATEDPAPAEAHGAAAEATAGSSVLLRGKVELRASGVWTARVTVEDPAGEVYSAEAVLESINGGPNRLYLLATGSLIGGALIFGAVKRRFGTAARAAGTR